MGIFSYLFDIVFKSKESSIEFQKLNFFSERQNKK